MLAVPAFKAIDPSAVVPSMKVTEPVGVPPPGDTAETTTVIVTLCPSTLALGDKVTLGCVVRLIDALSRDR